MLYFLISMLIMTALLDRALRVGRKEEILLGIRFKLFALRDELRQGVIQGTMPDNRWFEYLDTTITKAIDLLPTITAWEALALALRYRNNVVIIQARSTLYDALQKEENHKLGDIYAKFVMCIIELLFYRHIAIRFLMTGVVRVAGRARGFKKKVAEMITVAPETSTLTQYALSPR